MRQMTLKSPYLKGRRAMVGSLAGLAVLALAAAGCGNSSSPSTKSTTSTTAAHKGGTFTILANSAFGVADPAQNYTLEEWQLLINTHDGLVGFAHVGGIAGTKIVPDLATAIPNPSPQRGGERTMRCGCAFHYRFPVFAAFSASHHHTVRKAGEAYFGSSAGWLKRSQRAVRLLP